MAKLTYDYGEERLVSCQPMLRPFLKWLGGKSKCMSFFNSYFPENINNFFDVFAGGGSVSLNVNYKSIFINDINTDLYHIYLNLQKYKKKFINDCKLYFDNHNTLEKYLEIRNEFNTTKDLYKRSTLFLYLNRHCFNGLCRYNNRGIFNAHFGHYEKVYFPEIEMETWFNRLNLAHILNYDFREIFSMAKPGDFLYCDPPYVSIDQKVGFVGYAKNKFTLIDQKDLAYLANVHKKNGVCTIISNHDTNEVRKLYQDATEIKTLKVSRTVNTDAENRHKAKEILAIFKPE